MRKNIIVMNVLVVFFWMGVYSYVPNLPQYSQSLGADAVVLGIIGGVYGVAQIILRIPIGVISDNTGKNKLLMVIGSVVLALSCGILILAGDTNLIILGRLIAGAAAAWWVIQSATYADYHTDDIQVKAQGVLGASANWGKLAAALVGGLIAQFLGVRSIFIFAFAVAIVCIILSTRLTDIPKNCPKKTASQSFKDLLPLFRNRDLIVFSVIGILTNIILFAAPTYFTAVAAENLGASRLDIGLLNLVFYLFAAITSMLVGTRLYKKAGGIRAVTMSFLLAGVACIPIFYHINLPVIYLMQAVTGICLGVAGSAVAGMMIRSVSPEERGAATGIYQSLYGIGIIAGPVMVGAIIKAASFDASYWTLVAVSIATAIFCYLLIPKKYANM